MEKKLRKPVAWLLTIAMLMTFIPSFSLTASAATTEGYDGTPVTPTQITSDNYAAFGLTADNWSDYKGYYGIRTAAELYGFAALVNSAGNVQCNAILLDDIVVNTGTVTASGSSGGTTYAWTPIGVEQNAFIGTFDGNGHTISGLYYNNVDELYVGLFGLAGISTNVLDNGTANIKNVVLQNSYICGKLYGGGIVGAAQGNFVTITSCKVAEDVTVHMCNINHVYVGGILGSYISSEMFLSRVNRVTDCVNMGTVSSNGSYCIGALVGAYRAKDNAFAFVEVENCYYKQGCATDNEGKVKQGLGLYDESTDSGCSSLSGASASHTCVSVTHKERKATCQYTGLSEYSFCLICGKVTSGTRQEYAVTEHSYTTATCKTPATCIYCGVTTGTTDGSKHEGQIIQYISVDEQYHCGVYNCCDGHTGNSLHNYKDANCLAVQTCLDCGETTGDKNASNHTGTEKIYELNTTDRSMHDYKWNCCGLVIETAKHTYENSHCILCNHDCKHLNIGNGKCLDCGEAGVEYVNRYWDSQTSSVVSQMAVTVGTVTVTNSTVTMEDGWYVLESDVIISERIKVNGTVNLILADGYTLTASSGINVPSGSVLNIYGQVQGTGKLLAEASSNHAGIGGGFQGSGGTVTINGGTVTASGTNGGAGIGGGFQGSGGTVTINGGTVTASGTNGGAGIGGGHSGSGGAVTVNGGTVTASGTNGGAGIGGGSQGSGGTVTVNGGTVTASGTSDNRDIGCGAGIGGGHKSNGGTVTIKGGNIKAVSSFGSQIGAGYAGASSGTLTDGNGNAVSLKTFVLEGVTGQMGVTTVSGLNGYGINDVHTLDTDRLYFYLLSDPSTVTITAGDVEYVFVCNRSGVFYTAHDASAGYKYVENAQDSAKHDVCYACCNLFIETVDHNFVGEGTCRTPAVCSQCGAKSYDAGNHESDQFKYAINAEDNLKHDVHYACCEVLAETVSHTYTNGRCLPCGYICNHPVMQDGVCTTCGSSGHYYMDRVWNAEKKVVVSQLSKFTPDYFVAATTTNLNWTSGWYVLANDVTVTGYIAVLGDVKLVLLDGCTLTVDSGIRVTSGNSLTIYGQSADTGKLTVTASNYPAAIGGTGGDDCGTITINGGTVIATTNGYGAGIGGGKSHDSGTVIINGGTVIATANSYGAGIGGGYDGNGGTVTINGGTVTAIGEKNGAGIGGDSSGNGGTVTINGGTVTAAGDGGAGIGGGSYGNGAAVVIAGGNIKATSDSGKAIGAGVSGSDSGMLTDGTNNVTLYTITLDGVTGQVPVTEITGVDNYGLNDVYTIDGVLYIYLPASANPTQLTADGTTYYGNITDGVGTFRATLPHTHQWTYSLGGADMIKATCTAGGCTNTNGGSITIVAPTLTVYGGTGSADATLSAETLGDYTNLSASIKYWEGDTELTSAPTDAGIYKAKHPAGDQDTDTIRAVRADGTYPASAQSTEIHADDSCRP